MIKNFKIFENDRYKYDYLNEDNEEILKKYLESTLPEYIKNGIENLILHDYETWNFSYRPIIDNVFFDKKFFNKLYSLRYDFDNATIPRIHNSFSNILHWYLSENKVYMKMGNKLTELFKKNPQYFIENYEWLEGMLSYGVKDKLSYLIKSKKFNL